MTDRGSDGSSGVLQIGVIYRSGFSKDSIVTVWDSQNEIAMYNEKCFVRSNGTHETEDISLGPCFGSKKSWNLRGLENKEKY